MDRIDKCEICKSSSDKLMSFNCLHTICSKCLYKNIFFNYKSIIRTTDSMETIKMKCIVCEQGFKNSDKKSLLKILKSTTDGENKILSCLYGHNNKIEFYCQDCKLLLCKICVEKHREFPPFLNHKISNNLKQANINNKCVLHVDEVLKFQCTTCSIPICRDCKDLDHSRHEIVNVNTFSKTKRDEVINSIKKPYINYDELCRNLNREDDKVRKELRTKSTEIIYSIENLIFKLQKMKTDLEVKLNLIEEDLSLSKEIIEIIFKSFYNDLETTPNDDFVNINYLSKFPDFYSGFKLSEKIGNNFDKTFSDLNKKLDNLNEQIKNINGVELEDPCITTLNAFNKSVESLLLLPDGKLVTGSAESIKIWDNRNNFTCMATLIGHTESVTSMILLSNGKFASGSKDKTIKIWNPEDNYNCCDTLTNHTDSVTFLALLPDGRLASASNDCKIIIWWPDMEFKCISIQTLSKCLSINYLLHLSNDKLACALADHNIQIWNLNGCNYDNLKSATKIILSGHKDSVDDLLQLHDGRLASSSQDNRIRIWDLNTYECVFVLRGHSDFISSLILLADGRIASGGGPNDKTIRIWDPEDSFNCVVTLSTGSISSLLLLNDGMLASASNDHVIRIWNPYENYKCSATLTGHTYFINPLIRLQGGMFASASGKSLKIWY